MGKIKLIYIGGIGRNGSTLLGRILGEHNNVINIGEALNFMMNSQLRNRHINRELSSGNKIESSIMWSEVFDKCGFSFISDDIDILLFEGNSKKLETLIENKDPRIIQVTEKVNRFLQVVKEVNQCSIIVDTSKNANIPLIVNACQDVDIYIVHLVRDIVDAVASRSKAKAYLNKVNFVRMTFRWIIKNNATANLGRKMHLKTTYFDDLCKSPYNFIASIFDFTGAKIKPKEELKSNNITFNIQDMIAGNPDKYDTGTVKIEYRDKKISWWKRGIVTVIAFPWILKFRKN